MIHLSSYHSNGLPTVVWSNKVNLIGEKVYKPKIHFCEHCNKPILIYGRLIPCKHVFCFSCATLCLNQVPLQTNNHTSLAALTPPNHGQSEPAPKFNQSPPSQYHHNHNQQSPHHNNSVSNHVGDKHYHQMKHSRGASGNNHHINSSNSKNLDMHRSDSNHSFSYKDNSGSLGNLDESTSNTTPTTIQQDTTTNSPSLNGAIVAQPPQQSQGCHRCGGRALRVERNTLNSIFVCQVDSCRRTYLSARDLQAHVAHRHSRNKSGGSNNAGTSSASMQAISSSPYISSSTLQLLNNNHNNQHGSNSHRLSASSSSTANNNGNATSNNNNSPVDHPHRRDRGPHHHQQHHQHHGGSRERSDRDRDRIRERERDRYSRNRDNYRDRDRDRDSKEYHRQSLQRAAQWAEASAQMLEKGLTR